MAENTAFLHNLIRVVSD